MNQNHLTTVRHEQAPNAPPIGDDVHGPLSDTAFGDMIDALRPPPAVLEAVVGRPDDVMGEAPIAFVPVRDGARLTPAETKEPFGARLAACKIPVDVVVPEIPSNPAAGSASPRRAAGCSLPPAEPRRGPLRHHVRSSWDS